MFKILCALLIQFQPSQPVCFEPSACVWAQIDHMIGGCFSHSGLFVPAGERWHGGVPAVAQRAEPLLLQAVDDPRPLSIFLPSLLAHNTCARPHVPHWCPVVHVATGTRQQFIRCVRSAWKTLKLAHAPQMERLSVLLPGHTHIFSNVARKL